MASSRELGLGLDTSSSAVGVDRRVIAHIDADSFYAQGKFVSGWLAGWSVVGSTSTSRQQHASFIQRSARRAMYILNQGNKQQTTPSITKRAKPNE
jgi:hypothetical protein